VCNHFETLMHFVLHGGGLSISGEVTVRDRVLRGELHAAQIREPGMGARAAELQTLSGRTLPAAVRMFLEFLQAQLRDNAAPATPPKEASPRPHPANDDDENRPDRALLRHPQGGQPDAQHGAGIHHAV